MAVQAIERRKAETDSRAPSPREGEPGLMGRSVELVECHMRLLVEDLRRMLGRCVWPALMLVLFFASSLAALNLGLEATVHWAREARGLSELQGLALVAGVAAGLSLVAALLIRVTLTRIATPLNRSVKELTTTLALLQEALESMASTTKAKDDPTSHDGEHQGA